MESVDINGLIHIVVLLGGILGVCKMFIGLIAKRIDNLEAGQNRFEIELANIKNNQANLEAGQKKFEIELKEVKANQVKFETGLTEIKENQVKLERDFNMLNNWTNEQSKLTDKILELLEKKNKK